MTVPDVERGLPATSAPPGANNTRIFDDSAIVLPTQPCTNAATSQRQPSFEHIIRYPNAFTSSAFNAFTCQPLPVHDVLHAIRPVIGTRLFVRTTSAIIIFTFLVSGGCLLFLIVGAILKVVSLTARDSANSANSENSGIRKRLWKGYKESTATAFTNLPVKFWEHVVARLLLTTRWRWTSACWWYIYMLLSSAKEFEINYIAAWKERMDFEDRNTVGYYEVIICVGEEQISIPISKTEMNDPANDVKLISHLRMFFRLLRLKRGLSELIAPKLLRRVDSVLVGSDRGVDSHWEMIEPLKLGTTKRRLKYFHEPWAASGSTDLSKQLSKLPMENPAFRLQFLREFDRAQFAVTIMAPPIASLFFFTIWTVVSLHYKAGVQVTITTALTGATYLVTAGALITALVAYFDKTMEDEDPRAFFKEILAQQAYEKIQPVAIARSEELDKVVKGLSPMTANTPLTKEVTKITCNIDNIATTIKTEFYLPQKVFAEEKTSVDNLNQSIKEIADHQTKVLTSLCGAADDKKLLTRAILVVSTKMSQLASTTSETTGELDATSILAEKQLAKHSLLSDSPPNICPSPITSPPPRAPAKSPQSEPEEKFPDSEIEGYSGTRGIDDSREGSVTEDLYSASPSIRPRQPCCSSCSPSTEPPSFATAHQSPEQRAASSGLAADQRSSQSPDRDVPELILTKTGGAKECGQEPCTEAESKKGDKGSDSD